LAGKEETVPANAVEELNEQLGAPAGDLDAELDELTAAQEGSQQGAYPPITGTSWRVCC